MKPSLFHENSFGLIRTNSQLRANCKLYYFPINICLQLNELYLRKMKHRISFKEIASVFAQKLLVNYLDCLLVDSSFRQRKQRTSIDFRSHISIYKAGNLN